jgi:energy-coupling factor transporter transmembrane protein EcfT
LLLFPLMLLFLLLLCTLLSLALLLLLLLLSFALLLLALLLLALALLLLAFALLLLLPLLLLLALLLLTLTLLLLLLLRRLLRNCRPARPTAKPQQGARPPSEENTAKLHVRMFSSFFFSRHHGIRLHRGTGRSCPTKASLLGRGCYCLLD